MALGESGMVVAKVEFVEIGWDWFVICHSWVRKEEASVVVSACTKRRSSLLYHKPPLQSEGLCKKLRLPYIILGNKREENSYRLRFVEKKRPTASLSFSVSVSIPFRVNDQIYPTPIQLSSPSLNVFRLLCIIAQTMPNWALKSCCKHDQVMFLATIGVFTVVILALWRTVLLTPFKLITVFLHEASHAIACILTCGKVEGIQVNANEGGATQTRGGLYWLILPAGYLGSSFWGMTLILASTNLLTARIAAGCFGVALIVVFFLAKNWTLRGLCIGFIILLAVVWVLQELTKIQILRYVILFIGVMNSLFSVYDIYDDLISRRVNSSDAEKFAEVCPCPCNGVGWGVIWLALPVPFLI